MTDAAGIVVYANPAALEFIGATRDEVVGRHFTECLPVEDAPFVAAVIMPTLERGAPWSGDFRVRNFRNGAALPIHANAFALADAAGRITGFATISRDRRDRERFDIGMRALAEAGKAMHKSLDLEATVQNIADAMVEGFASACSVEVIDADGRVRTMTLAARTSEHAAIARLAAETRNASVPHDHPIRRAIERGESTLKRSLEPTFLRSTGIDAHVGADEGKLDLRSVIYVPVRSPHDGRIYASLSCGLDARDPRGTYSDEDVRVAEEIAIRAGLAFDNAYAYERTRRVAVELQSASLPTALPISPDFALHAEYRPATDEAAIGGDWYDAFMLSDGRVAITIGDVVGHGLKAAIWMTKMRQSMQAAAMLEPEPRVMLDVANRTLLMLESQVYATALAAVFDPATRVLHVASAGHPAPLVSRRDGTIEELPCRGLLLGVAGETSIGTCAAKIEAGDLIVFFTDGLVEIVRDYEVGKERLREALRSEAIRGAENPALAIFERVTGGTIRDDVAILTARAKR
jgi:PAS domain S-box-containing protein